MCSRPDRCALFVGFLATMAESDFHVRASSPRLGFPMRTAVCRHKRSRRAQYGVGISLAYALPRQRFA